MSFPTYTDIIVEIKGQIGIIKVATPLLPLSEHLTNHSKFNRPKSLNSMGGHMLPETIDALRRLNEHPTTIFTVLTGEGRFFCAGADVKGSALLQSAPTYANDGEKKIAFLAQLIPGMEIVRTIIDHRKVFVLALNGPGVGAGGAWYQGISDMVFASRSAYIQTPFSALGLVPENGSAIAFAQSIGTQRANDILMFGRKVGAEELERIGMVNRIFPTEGFLDHVLEFLCERLEEADGKSLMEMKRLQNRCTRDQRMLAVYDAMDALTERFMEGAPLKRFEAKRIELAAKGKNRTSKI
ncbi:hypothetical protein B7494_g994 [Chlorociboria aeruginascens]|nr:hypothetical protein B7494_g994 [Chlorociboria aeruginascens]